MAEPKCLQCSDTAVHVLGKMWATYSFSARPSYSARPPAAEGIAWHRVGCLSKCLLCSAQSHLKLSACRLVGPRHLAAMPCFPSGPGTAALHTPLISYPNSLHNAIEVGATAFFPTCRGMLLVRTQRCTSPEAADGVARGAKRQPRLQRAQVHHSQRVVLSCRHHTACRRKDGSSLKAVLNVPCSLLQLSSRCARPPERCCLQLPILSLPANQ